MIQISELQALRHSYSPKLPKIFKNEIAIKLRTSSLKIQNIEEDIKNILKNSANLTLLEASSEIILDVKPLNIGIILSGGQAPGGHNVIAGIFDAAKSLNKDNKLMGFLGGPLGLLEEDFIEITSELIDKYRNTGGFDIIGSGRTKLESDQQFQKSKEILKKHNINSLVIIGGDDSNTNAAMLAEYLKEEKSDINIVGCPKTIDGDLKNEFIETSFGFDTATKVYSELIGNIARDAASAKKYWHFIKLMGRSASHIALECGLATQANITLISEEVAEQKMTLAQVIESIAEKVIARAKMGANYGLVLIPEGIIEFIPEMNRLIAELNDILAEHKTKWESFVVNDEKAEWLRKHLSSESSIVYFSLPHHIANQLVLDRDPHGNVQVSRIETEKLFIEMTEEYIERKQSTVKFSALNHFFGYEGRCAAPSNFDADYGYSIGYTATVLLVNDKSGYMASLKNLTAIPAEWKPLGVPIVSMMTMEKRHGHMKPVIKKALVELKGHPMNELVKNRNEWERKSSYIFPGPIQYFGPESICDIKTKTLLLENNKGE